jgi:uncharacterized protein (TIGR03089 family)
VTPYDLLRAELSRDSARPLVTFYDDATGERVELSVATYANWVAKTANLLQDELAVEPSERVGLALPAHWQATVVAMATWAVGAIVTPIPDGAAVPSRLAAVFASADRLTAAADATPRALVGLSLLPLGGRLQQERDGVLDFATEVPPQADRFAAYAPPGDDDAAWDGDPPLTQGELVDRARSAGLAAGSRVLTTRPLTSLDGVVTGLLGPLAAGGSVVLCRNLDPAQLDARLAAERVTVQFH